ncbi:MAG: tRNA pseudouridine(13) synthase TruD [Nitrososphaeria archaeon]|nr:tRNA pseudouridine(13) synthase TruD [Nitrososphaeria archaeon]
MLTSNIELEKCLGILCYVSSTEGIGGSIRGSVEDFKVFEDSEIPLNPRGSHIVLVIEKRNVTTDYVIRHISKTLGIDKRLIGFAGIKDSRAVVVQKFSIPFEDKIDVEKLNVEGKVRIIEAYPSLRKIRLGMLRGNNFQIILRNCNFRRDLIENILGELDGFGCPNYFGYQRFGTRRYNTHLIGYHLLREDYDSFVEELVYKVYSSESSLAKEARMCASEGYLRDAYNMMPRSLWIERKVLGLMLKNFSIQKIVRLLGKSLLKFYVNAYQSYLFNLMLSERIRRGLPLNRCVDGDFVKAGEPAFPLLGYKSKFPRGEVGEIVKSVVEKENFELTRFKNKKLGLKVKGSLRKLRLNFKDLRYAGNDNIVCFNFWLEKGCYATALLREFCKNEFFV